MREAWTAIKERIEPEVLAQIEALLHKAHDDAQRNASGGEGGKSAPGEMALVLSALDAQIEEPGVELDVPLVLSDGTIMGCEPYEQLDPEWLLAVAEWLNHPPPYPVAFRNDPQCHAIPDELVLGLLGDWGAGDFEYSQTAAVAAALAACKPHVSVHLGDVYHCGTPENERAHLIERFPHGSLGSYALNSNHEMYAGGVGYFETLLDGAPAFAQQGGCSYFALENDQWVVVGLDSAYFGSWPEMGMNGALDDHQTRFLAQQAAKGKSLVILTHHPGLHPDGSRIEPYFSQVTAALDPSKTNLWYCGHDHAGYVMRKEGPVSCRCIGHGSLPYGYPSVLAESDAVTWFEHEAADPWPRLLNGFAVLHFRSDGLLEEICDSRGRCRWSQHWELG